MVIGDRRQSALDYVASVRRRWQWLLDELDTPLAEAEAAFDDYGVVAGELVNTAAAPVLFHRLQDYSVRTSWKTELAALDKIFDGKVFGPVLARIEAIHAEVLRGRVFVALHMHAGDGNVHQHPGQLRQLRDAADRQQGRRPHHGAGPLARRGDFRRARHRHHQARLSHRAGDVELLGLQEEVDPNGHFNRGKLMPGANLDRAYTPSFNLMGHESLIMEQTEIGAIAHDIKDCLRCGKCKPVCSTHVPTANLLYSPRNKILSTSLLVEAMLYEEQTRRGVSLAHWAEFEDIADHCTVCHKCENPARWISTSATSRSRCATCCASRARSPSTRQGRGDGLPHGQGSGHHQADPHRHDRVGLQGTAHGVQGRQVAGPDPAAGQVAAGHARQGTAQGPGDPLHQQTDARQPAQAHQPRAARHRGRQGHPGDPQPAAQARRVGCGVLLPGLRLERPFSQVGLATQAMLYHVGATTVLPPGYLCCGYPQTAAGEEDKGQQITTDNRVLFHRVANTLNYLDIKTVVVSCGTCMDQLLKYQFDKIFPGCRLIDIHEYLMEKGVRLEGIAGTKYMYHEPCHTPMKIHPASRWPTS